MRAVDERMADRLTRRGWTVTPPVPVCLAHGEHPHDGRVCLDCPVCAASLRGAARCEQGERDV